MFFHRRKYGAKRRFAPYSRAKKGTKRRLPASRSHSRGFKRRSFRRGLGSRRVYRGRHKRLGLASSRSRKILLASGTYIDSTGNDHLAQTTAGLQAVNLANVAVPSLNTLKDINNIAVNIMDRVAPLPTVSTNQETDRFCILSSTLRLNIVNSYQVDAIVTLYPFTFRYPATSEIGTYLYNCFYKGAEGLETPAETSGTTYAIGDYGWTPFQSRGLCECVKFWKPKGFHLQGGESKQFRFKRSKPRYYNLAKIYGLTAGGGTDGAFAYDTIGVIIVAKGVAVNDPSTKTNIAASPVNIDFIFSKEYKWGLYMNPFRYGDHINNTESIGSGFKIIQPQTGTVVTTPATT